MTVLTDTQVVTASGGLVELGYSEIMSIVTVSSTTEGASGTSVIPALTVVCDGSPVLVEFCAGRVDAPSNASGNTVITNLLYDGANQGRLSLTGSGSNAQVVAPVFASFRITPAAGVHTFAVTAFRSNANGYVWNDNNGRAFLRVSKIVQATQWPAVTTGSIICTSSTRPASPFAGQQIYETDTSKSLIYSGSVWQPPWNTAWGSVAAPATWGSNTITSTSTADTTLASVTFVAVAGRRYRTSWIFDTYCGAGYGVNVKVKNGATLIASVAYVGGVPANANANLDGSYVISGISAGSCTINLTANSSTATLTYYGSVVAGQFAIEDVGPA